MLGIYMFLFFFSMSRSVWLPQFLLSFLFAVHASPPIGCLLKGRLQPPITLELDSCVFLPCSGVPGVRGMVVEGFHTFSVDGRCASMLTEKQVVRYN